MDQLSTTFCARIMPKSIRKMSKESRQKKERDSQNGKARQEALEMLKRGLTLRQVVSQSGVSMGTMSRINKARKMSDMCALHTLLHPEENPAGRRLAISSTAEKVIVDKLLIAASRGFAVDKMQLKRLCGEVAESQGRPFKSGIPCDEWIASFRARHTDRLTFRAHQCKEIAKLAAESNVAHVASYKDVLEKVFLRHPAIQKDPRLVWNMDETAVTGELGEKKKVFTSSKSNACGYRATEGKGIGKHLTAVLIANADGKVLPPFFVFEGKKEMKAWFAPLVDMNERQLKDPLGERYWFSKEGWFPKDAFTIGTANGSMQQHVIHYVIDHIRRHTKDYIEEDEHLLLLLDGHKSRYGWEWLDRAVKNNIEIAQSPANTTHFLQACDSTINKKFQQSVRRVRDVIASNMLVDFGKMQLKLIMAIGGMRSLQPDVVRMAFQKTGLWPMDFRFLSRVEYNQGNLEEGSPSSDKAIQENVAVDGQLVRDVRKACAAGCPGKELENILRKVIKKEVDAVKKVEGFMLDASKSLFNTSRPIQSRVSLRCGLPASYLTHGDLLETRKKMDKKKREKVAEKEKRKEERINKKKKIASIEENGDPSSEVVIPDSVNVSNGAGAFTLHHEDSVCVDALLALHSPSQE